MDSITLQIQSSPENLELSIGDDAEGIVLSIDESGAAPSYTGAYEVTPSRAEQVLATAHRTMRRNVTIHEIPFYETTNPYGKTYVIGE